MLFFSFFLSLSLFVFRLRLTPSPKTIAHGRSNKKHNNTKTLNLLPNFIPISIFFLKRIPKKKKSKMRQCIQTILADPLRSALQRRVVQCSPSFSLSLSLWLIAAASTPGPIRQSCPTTACAHRATPPRTTRHRCGR